MRKTMIALMVGLAVLVVFGPSVSKAGSVNGSFGFFFGPYGVAQPTIVYNPYYAPPVVYNPYVTGFGFSFGPSHPRHPHHWGRHHGRHWGRGHRHGHGRH